MGEKTKALRMDSVVIKTAMSPEQLAEYIGGSIEWSSTASTKKHVVFMPRADFDAVYARRQEDLLYYLDEVNKHVKSGNITPDAENAVAQCMGWALEQLQLMKAEQKKLIEWIMSANDEVASIPRRKGAQKRHGGNPASLAMAAIREVWEPLQRPGAKYAGDAAFAKEMHCRYAGEIRNEGSIKNAIVRWRKGRE